MDRCTGVSLAPAAVPCCARPSMIILLLCCACCCPGIPSPPPACQGNLHPSSTCTFDACFHEGKGLTSVLVNSLGEHVDEGGGLQALVEDAPLALEPDVLGELDEAADVALGLHIVADAEVLGLLLEERVLLLLGAGLLARGRGGGSSLGTLGLRKNRLSVSLLPPTSCIACAHPKNLTQNHPIWSAVHDSRRACPANRDHILPSCIELRRFPPLAHPTGHQRADAPSLGCLSCRFVKKIS